MSVVTLCRILFSTLRIRYHLGAPNTNPYDPACTEGFIFSVWHEAIAFPMFAGRHFRTVALVSKHFDGSHLAYGLKILGIGLVRGSSGRNGATAIRDLLRLPMNTHLVVTPDGPRGPRRTTKIGLVFIASHSGRAIVPTAFCARRSWKIRGSWTDVIVPKPFTTVYALSGRPISVPQNASPQELADAQREVQAQMDRLTDEAEQMAGKKPSPVKSSVPKPSARKGELAGRT